MDILGLILTLRGLSYSKEAYIVGGTVRDLLIGRDPVDIDIVVSTEANKFAQILSEKVNGTFFLLDKKRGVIRVATKSEIPPFYYDIAPIRGKDIYADLSLRDFTIDAIAVSLTGDSGTIIDPYNGESDINNRCIRVLSRKSFEDDPLRLLRAFRLAGIFSFRIDSETLNIIREMSYYLRVTARERIRDEFFTLLSSNNSAQYLDQMYYSGLLKEILYGLDEATIKDGLKIIASLEHLYDNLKYLFHLDDASINNYLLTTIENGIRNSTLWKWLSFYMISNATKSLMRDSLVNLRLGNKANKVALLAVGHMKVRILDKGIEDRRSLWHFFRATGDNGIGLILYQLASVTSDGQINNRALRNVRDAISWYLLEYKKIKISPLITGNDLKELFHISDGPALGSLLYMVEENRAVGLLVTKKDAITFLNKLLTNI